MEIEMSEKINKELAQIELVSRMKKAKLKYPYKEYSAYMDGILDFMYSLEESNPELTYDLHSILNSAEETIEGD